MSAVLTLTGQFLGVNREMVNPKPGQQWQAFERVTVDVLVRGRNGNRVEACEATQGFEVGDLPAEGSQVTLEVSVRAFNSAQGGGYGLRALGIVRESAGLHAVDAAGLM